MVVEGRRVGREDGRRSIFHGPVVRCLLFLFPLAPTAAAATVAAGSCSSSVRSGVGGGFGAAGDFDPSGPVDVVEAPPSVEDGTSAES